MSPVLFFSVLSSRGCLCSFRIPFLFLCSSLPSCLSIVGCCLCSFPTLALPHVVCSGFGCVQMYNVILCLCKPCETLIYYHIVNTAFVLVWLIMIDIICFNPKYIGHNDQPFTNHILRQSNTHHKISNYFVYCKKNTHLRAIKHET